MVVTLLLLFVFGVGRQRLPQVAIFSGTIFYADGGNKCSARGRQRLRNQWRKRVGLRDHQALVVFAHEMLFSPLSSLLLDLSTCLFRTTLIILWEVSFSCQYIDKMAVRFMPKTDRSSFRFVQDISNVTLKYTSGFLHIKK